MSKIHSIKSTEPQSPNDECRKLTVKHRHEITYLLRKSKEWYSETIILRFINYENGTTGWYLMEDGGLGQKLETKWSTGKSKVRERFRNYPFVAQVTVVSTTIVNKVRS